MRRLILLACTAAIGSGIFWVIYDSTRLGSETSSLEAPSISKKGKGAPKLKEDSQSKSALVESPSVPEKSIRSIPPLDLYSWPIELAASAKLAEIKEPKEVWETKPNFREVKNIVPPIAGVHPPASATLISEELIKQGGIINLGFHAYLHLPANALVDEWGNPIDEAVKISYCPLSDPIDVYLSGVPMSYDSAGGTETFSTAGMVRLEAETYSGKMVSLKRGQSMRLDMPTSASTDDFNFYTFNEEQGGWSFDRPAPPARPAIDLLIDTLNIKYDFDTTSFGAKFSNMEYHYLTNVQVKGKRYMLNSGRILTTALEKSIREALYDSRFSSTNLIRLNPSSPIVAYTEDHKPIREVQFKLSFVGKGNGYFRELRHFSGYTFVAEDVKNLQEFYKHYRRGRKFHDIRVEYENGADQCTLILKDEKEMVHLKARITRGARAEFTAISKMRFAHAHQRYTRDLKKKELVHDEIIQKKKRQIAANSIRSRNTVVWMQTTNYRQLTIPGFATYNCDQIARMKKPRELPRSFVREDQSKITPDILMVCDAKAKATFNFYSFYKIKPACSEGGLAFIMVTSGDKTYYMSGKEAREKMNEKQWVLKELPDVKDGNELRALLLGG